MRLPASVLVLVLACVGTACTSEPTGTAASASTPAAGTAGTAGALGGDEPQAPGARAASGAETGAGAQAGDGSAPVASVGAEAGTGADPAASAGTTGMEASPGADAVAGGPAPSGDACGGTSSAPSPFGCDFAWGRDDPGGSLDSYAGLDFMSKWVGYEVIDTRELTRCDGCAWLRDQVQGTTLTPVYYAYFIGFLGKAYGLPDGNENPDGPSLTTDGARVLREHREQLLEMYRWYAEQTRAAWGERPLVWLLEGDFIQYATSELQTQPLSLPELAELARDITCAIKGAMPSALVAINHTTWNSDEETDAFWEAMANAGVNYDLVWTTGVADNDGYLEQGADPDIYNAATATYAYVANKTGRRLFVDTSFGLSAMADSWSSASPATLQARIADGVIAAHVTGLPADRIATIEALRGQLGSVCE